MEKLFALFVLALAANGVVSRPQSNTNDDRFGGILVIDQAGNLIPMQFPNQPGFQDFPNFTRRPTRPVQQTTTSAPVTPGSGTTSSEVAACVVNCPVTAEYNPVCGSDNVVYTNPSRLQCAADCGVNVRLLRAAPCPATTPAPAS